MNRGFRPATSLASRCTKNASSSITLLGEEPLFRCAATLVQLRWKKDLPMLRTRRRLLQSATIWPALHALRAARKEFWENKDPAKWSDEEKRTLLGKSPWAREGIVRFEVERKDARSTGPYEGVQRPGGGVPGALPGGTPGGVTSVP